jgi:hypothetical protein
MSDDKHDTIIFFYTAFGGESVVMFGEQYMLIHPKTLEYVRLRRSDNSVMEIRFEENNRYKMNTAGARWMWDALQDQGFEQREEVDET